jgi:predicted amidophosphoribosyltransferase
VCFPTGCRLCDEILLDSSRLPVCANCLSSFPEIPPGSCDGCGLPGTFDPEFPKELSYCQDCQQHRFAFDLVRSFGFYDGGLARAILLLKHEQIEPTRKVL